MKTANYISTDQDIYDCVNNINGGDPSGRQWFAKGTIPQDKLCLTHTRATNYLYLDASKFQTGYAGNELVKWQELSPAQVCGAVRHCKSTDPPAAVYLGTNSGKVNLSFSNIVETGFSGANQIQVIIEYGNNAAVIYSKQFSATTPFNDSFYFTYNGTDSYAQLFVSVI